MPRDDGKVLYGQIYDDQKGRIRPFTQQEQQVTKDQPVAGIGLAHTEVVPTDANASQVRTFDVSAVVDDLLAQDPYIYETLLSFDLPVILTGISLTFNSNSGAGNDLSDGTGVASGNPIQLSLSSESKATGSASILPDVIPTFDTPEAVDISGTNYEFYVPNGTSRADLLTKLSGPAYANATVLAWPIFHKEPVYLSLQGQSASLQANASVRRSYYISNTNTSESEVKDQGYSIEVGVSLRDKEIQPTLHGEIDFSPSTVTANVTASAAAGWTGSDAFPSGSAASNPTTTSVVVTGSASPSPNGTYTQIGNINGFPAYVFGTYALFHIGGTWVLQVGFTIGSDYWDLPSSSILPSGDYTAFGAYTGSPHVAASTDSPITITATVSPTTISATTPTDIPRSGLYLKRLSIQPDESTGIMAVVATVVDMSQFA